MKPGMDPDERAREGKNDGKRPKATRAGGCEKGCPPPHHIRVCRGDLAPLNIW